MQFAHLCFSAWKSQLDSPCQMDFKSDSNFQLVSITVMESCDFKNPGSVQNRQSNGKKPWLWTPYFPFLAAVGRSILHWFLRMRIKCTTWKWKIIIFSIFPSLNLMYYFNSLSFSYWMEYIKFSIDYLLLICLSCMASDSSILGDTFPIKCQPLVSQLPISFYII